MKILMIGASTLEIMDFLDYLKLSSTTSNLSYFALREIEIHTLITGVGPAHAAFSIGQKKMNDFDFAIHAGISGTNDFQLELGDVVEVDQEIWADLGAETPDGQTLSLGDLGLMDIDEHPYTKAVLKNPNAGFTNLPIFKGITVSKATGSALNAKRLRESYPGTVESMEGAAIFYGCLMKNCKFYSVRAISNYVGERNKSTWRLKESIHNLNVWLIHFIQEIDSGQRKLISSI